MVAPVAQPGVEQGTVDTEAPSLLAHRAAPEASHVAGLGDAARTDRRAVEVGDHGAALPGRQLPAAVGGGALELVVRRHLTAEDHHPDLVVVACRGGVGHPAQVDPLVPRTDVRQPVG